MKNTDLRSFLASVLALAMLFSLMTTAFADAADESNVIIKETVVVENNEVFIDDTRREEYSTESGVNSLDASIVITENDADTAAALVVSAGQETGRSPDADSSYFAVNGSVVAEALTVEPYMSEVHTAAVSSDGSSSEDSKPVEAIVTIGSDLAAVAEADSLANASVLSADAAGADASENANTVVYVQGQTSSEAKSENDAAYSWGAVAYASGEGSSTTLGFGSDVTSAAVGEEDALARAVMTDSVRGGETTVTADGTISAQSASEGKNSGSDATGVVALSQDKGSLTTVNANGGVAAEAKGDQSAIAAAIRAGSEYYGESVNGGEYQFFDAGDVRIHVTGDVMAVSDFDNEHPEAKNNPAGNHGVAIEAYAGDSSTGITVAGNVTAESAGNTAAILAKTHGESSVISVSVVGDVLSVSNAERPEKNSDSDENQENSGTEALRTWNSWRSNALTLTNDGGAIDVSVVGNVAAVGGEAATAVLIQSDPYVSENRDGETSVTVKADEQGSGGSVYSDDVALSVKLSGDQTANVLVDGTIEGVNASIVVNNETIVGENLTLTVWEIVPDKNGNLVSVEETNIRDDVTGYAANTEAEEHIQYIIKVDPASEGYIETSIDKDENGYLVAEEGDTVLLKLNIADGYRIKEINGRKAEILQEEGVYYLVVPRGGGVLLSVTLEENGKPGSGTETGKNDGENSKPVSADETAKDAIQTDSKAGTELKQTITAISQAEPRYPYTPNSKYAMDLQYFKENEKEKLEGKRQKQIYRIFMTPFTYSDSKGTHTVYRYDTGICNFCALMDLYNRFIAYHYGDYSSPLTLEEAFKAIGKDSVPESITFERKTVYIKSGKQVKKGTEGAKKIIIADTTAGNKTGYIFSGGTMINNYTYNDGRKNHKITRVRVNSEKQLAQYRTPEGLAELVKKHPEGIYVHTSNSNGIHAVIISDVVYENGHYTFTVLDPVGKARYTKTIQGKKREIMKTHKATIDDIDEIRFLQEA